MKNNDFKEIWHNFLVGFFALLVWSLVMAILFFMYGCKSFPQKKKLDDAWFKEIEWIWDKDKKAFVSGYDKNRVLIKTSDPLMSELVCYSEYELDNICLFRDN